MRCIAFKDDAATAGSCCSQIYEAFLAAPGGQELLSMHNGAAALALMGVILIDTLNLSPMAQKATHRDHAAVKALDAAIKDRGSLENLFERLDAAKFDDVFWSKLSVEQCLRYDFKEFESAGKRFGMSSCLCNLKTLAGKDGWAEVVAARAAQFDLFCVMTMTRAGEIVEREVMLTSQDESLTSKAAQFLSAYDKPPLQLESTDLLAPPGTSAFRQLNTRASRKQVAPCIAAFFASLPVGRDGQPSQ
eukprot:gnl/TRDRNA2_/TRDRNA2_91935_c1_seq1.p1 gnl/TRDRNA2_/TRDRNA2_91935_c1~~gnl/TRDRNA2_/TRDRNA2_91935_c1_seq1.p1  ORF type:complete len:247 (+),score=55.05 gnl/TRDRNA2_/TRDRNA2_91935_c1_seq1:386-1126(+)